MDLVVVGQLTAHHDGVIAGAGNDVITAAFRSDDRICTAVGIQGVVPVAEDNGVIAAVAGSAVRAQDDQVVVRFVGRIQIHLVPTRCINGRLALENVVVAQADIDVCACNNHFLDIAHRIQFTANQRGHVGVCQDIQTSAAIDHVGNTQV